MKQKLIITACFSAAVFMFSCNGDKKTEGTETTTETSSTNPEPAKANTDDYDPKRGEGTYNAENVKLGALDAAQAKKGEAIAESKCLSCHKLTDERLVGPGWHDVTKRHEPFWIMNFITNPDPMIDKDPKVQAQLELCLVRMPNQNLQEDEARDILEFMRKNDGVL